MGYYTEVKGSSDRETKMTTETTSQALSEQREALCNEWRYWDEEFYAAPEAGPAKAALDAFDAAHPELVPAKTTCYSSSDAEMRESCAGFFSR